jgi:hypothetical protein
MLTITVIIMLIFKNCMPVMNFYKLIMFSSAHSFADFVPQDVHPNL